MIISKEPTHSLGGYSNREPWSRTWRKEKKGIFYVGYGDTRTTWSEYFLILYPNFFSTIASGPTPIGSAGSAPDEVAVIRVTEHALEHFIDYLVKR
jgi:hypothetical protein